MGNAQAGAGAGTVKDTRGPRRAGSRLNFATMDSRRQKKVASLLQQELADLFQREGSSW